MAIDGMNGANGQNDFDPYAPMEYKDKDMKNLDRLWEIYRKHHNDASQKEQSRDFNGDGKITAEGDLPALQKLINKFDKFARDVYSFSLSKDGQKVLEKRGESGINSHGYQKLVDSCQNFVQNFLEKRKEEFKKGTLGATEEQYQQAEVWNQEVTESLAQDKALIESTNPDDLAAIKELAQKYSSKKAEIDKDYAKANDTYKRILTPAYSGVSDALKTLQTHIDSINETLADLEPDDSDANIQRLEKAQTFVTAQMRFADPKGFKEVLAAADKEGDGQLLYCEQHDPALMAAKNNLQSAIRNLRGRAEQKGIGSREREIYQNGIKYLTSLESYYTDMCAPAPQISPDELQNIYSQKFEADKFKAKNPVFVRILNYFANDKGDLDATSIAGLKKYFQDYGMDSNDESRVRVDRFLTKDDVEYLERFMRQPEARRNVSSLIGRPSKDYDAKLAQQKKDEMLAAWKKSDDEYAERWAKAVAWYWSGDNRSHDPIDDLRVIGYTRAQAQALLNNK